MEVDRELFAQGEPPAFRATRGKHTDIEREDRDREREIERCNIPAIDNCVFGKMMKVDAKVDAASRLRHYCCNISYIIKAE